ncbi:MAG TPA: hypothetical protein DEO85_16995 [Maritimibacter sp.]|nr:hypothetical protein [Maritimibacter sp.]
MRLVLLLLSLPWWAYVPMAGGVGYLGHVVHEGALETETTRAKALASGPPPVVDLSIFDPDADIGLANEVNVTGWIDPDHNYTLVKRTNGVKTSERYLYMMFGTQDGADAREVKAAIVFDAHEKERFLAQVDDHAIGLHENTYLFNFNGYAKRNNSLSAMVTDAIADEGLTKAEGFVYLTPFLAGRDAALAPQRAPDKERGAIWIAAAVLLLFGAVRKLASNTTPKRGEHDPDPLQATRTYVPQVPGGANKALDYDYTFKANKQDVPRANTIKNASPLGRLSSGKGAKGQGAEEQSATTGWATQTQDDPREQLAVRAALAAKDRLAKTFKQFSIALGLMVGIVYAVVNATPLLGANTSMTVIAGLLALLAVLFVPAAIVVLAIRWSGARFAIRAAGGKEAVARAAAMTGQLSTRVPEAWTAEVPAAKIDRGSKPIAATPGPSETQEPAGPADNPTPQARAPGPAYYIALTPFLVIALGAAAYIANEKLAVYDVTPWLTWPVWDHLSNTALAERFGVEPPLAKTSTMIVASLVAYFYARLLSRLKGGKPAPLASPRADIPAATLPRSPLTDEGMTAQRVTAKVSDSLLGSRAWVKQTARSAPRTAQHIVVDPREKMRDDPFAKLARDARRPV